MTQYNEARRQPCFKTSSHNEGVAFHNEGKLGVQWGSDMKPLSVMPEQAAVFQACVSTQLDCLHINFALSVSSPAVLL